MTFTLTYFCIQVHFKPCGMDSKGKRPPHSPGQFMEQSRPHQLNNWAVFPRMAANSLHDSAAFTSVAVCLPPLLALHPTKVWEGSSRLGLSESWKRCCVARVSWGEQSWGRLVSTACGFSLWWNVTTEDWFDSIKPLSCHYPVHWWSMINLIAKY